MSLTVYRLLLVGSTTLSTMMTVGVPVLSIPINEVMETNYNEEDILDSSLDQSPSVSQFSDVQPTDWAFQSLQSLIERYGVFFASSDGKFRGNQALTRYEFASILNQVLTQFNDLITTGKTELIRKEDLVILQKLKEDFSAEIVTLNERINTLESQTNKLEKSQFSSTTKLTGEAIFAVTDILSGDDGINRVNNAGVPNLTPRQNTVFASRVRLNFNSSFTGEDQLILRLQKDNFNTSTNFNGFTIASGFTNFTQGGLHQSLEGQQTFNTQKSYIIGSSPSEGIVLDSLRYTFPIGTGTKVVIAANGGEYADYVPTLNPYFEDFDGGNGAVSSFAQRSPIYRMGSDFGAGIGVTTKLNDFLSLSLGYMANGTGNFSSSNRGLFNGSFSTLVQLTVTPSDRFSLGLTYNYTYLSGEINKNFAGVTGTKLTTANTFEPEDTYNPLSALQKSITINYKNLPNEPSINT